MSLHDSILDTIGGTPVVRLHRIGPGHVRLYAKVESFNPGGSVKDRLALAIVLDAERKGLLKPGDTIVEATSGNTGVALAMVAAARGYKFVAVMTETFSIERRKLMRAYGAKVILTPAAEHTRGARDRAIRYCEQHPKATFFLNQHGNPNNGRAHITTTGPEIWAATEGQIDTMLIGLGTGGTFEGLSTYLKGQKPSIRIVGFEPATSPVYAGGKQGEHHLIGIGPGFVTENFQRARANMDEILHIEDDAAYAMVRRIAREEGLLVGPTSGAAAVAAEQLIARDGLRGQTIGLIFYDTGERYLNVKGLFPADTVEFEA